jgi:hypothetical protein
MRIARVFPRRTNGTPIDSLAFIGDPGLFPPEVDAVHISVSFSWDIPEADRLFRSWSSVAPTEIGGPAIGMPGADFTPGMYLKHGYVITSRGCPNRCWFCSVPEREGLGIREYPITEGFNILDDNLLACSDSHILQVFEMLKRQKQRAQFTGGLEAARLQDWHINLFADLKPEQMFFAYDTPNDYEPLALAANKLKEAGFNRHCLRCFVLIGYKGDTIEKAEKRLLSVVDLGMFPSAMPYRDKTGIRDNNWMKFQKKWSRPASIYAEIKNKLKNK